MASQIWISAEQKFSILTGFSDFSLKQMHIVPKLSRLIIAVAIVLFIFNAATVQAQVGIVKPPDQNTGADAPTLDTLNSGNQIDYHFGNIMLNPHNVYFIWYGNWNGNNATTLLPSFISGLNGSSYFNINTTYGNNSSSIANTVSMSKQVFDNYSQGASLTDQKLQTIISSKLLSGELPTDVNGIYFVLSSADVDENNSAGEFCVNFCGFHNHATLNGAEIKFAFVGNQDRPACISSGCNPQPFNSPNGNTGADAMVNIIAHELNETVTDPDGFGWYRTSLGPLGEVGDLCNFNFGPTFTTSNSSKANMILTGKNFLVQQNWVNGGGGFCAMSLFLTEPLFNSPLFLGTPQSPQVQFSWSQVPHNAGYRIMVAATRSALPIDPNSGSCIPDNTACTINDSTILKDITTFTSSTASPHNLLPETTYFWQVHGLAPDPLLPGFWSAVSSFTTSVRLSVSSQGTGRGTITSSDGSVNCGVSCSALFNPGTTVTLTAVPASGSTFTGWNGCSSGTSTCTVTMNAALGVTANFTQQSTTGLANFSIIPATVVGGTSTLGLIMLSGPAPANTTVSLTDNNPHFAQIPPPGSTSTGSVAIPQGANGTTFPITTSFTSSQEIVTITATDGITIGTFVTVLPVAINGVAFNPPSVVGGSPAPFMVSLNGPAGPGTLLSLKSSDPSVLQVPDTMVFPTGTNNLPITGTTFQVNAQTTVTVTASYNLSTAPPAPLTVLPATSLLTVMKQGSGTGMVTSNDGSINCGSTCIASFNNGTTVTLTAIPASGSMFVAWSGGSCSGNQTCVVTINSAQTIFATFAQQTQTFALQVSKMGTGSGTITSNDGLINCGSTCSNNYQNGAMVTLTASAASGSTFTGWSGGVCSGISTCTLTMNSSQTVIATFTLNVGPLALHFVPVPPCRVADTRNPNGPFGGPFLSGGVSRGFTIPNSACGIPATAQAYSLNATVVPHVKLGFLTMFPCGQSLPLASTLNSIDGRIKAGAAIVPAGASGGVCAFPTDDTDLILDINGYFVPASSTPSSLAFYPVPPCRLVDTRETTGPLGGPSMVGNATRIFPILSSSCNVPNTAQAYSLNYTSVPKGKLSFLTTWPAGQTQPLVSTLNAPTGTVTANAAIVPAGTNGDISVFVTEDSNLVIDISGYFAPPGPGGLSLFPLTPCRVLDTRNPAGSPPFIGTLNVDVTASGCAPPASSQAHVLNATVVPPGPLGFLTLWPQGTTQPLVSTLNAGDGAITSNMAIVPTANGSISAFVPDKTHLVLDISGYFAP